MKTSIFAKTVLFIFFTLVSLKNYGQENMLCQGNYWSEDDANKMMKTFASQWNDRTSWEKHADIIKQGIIEGMQLSKMPREDGDFNAIIRNTRVMDGYLVENIAIESFPGFYISGNLYRPIADEKKYAGILLPHGHGPDGRFGNDIQTLGAVFARMGAVVFAYDMVGYGESQQVAHKIPIALLL